MQPHKPLCHYYLQPPTQPPPPVTPNSAPLIEPRRLGFGFQVLGPRPPPPFVQLNAASHHHQHLFPPQPVHPLHYPLQVSHRMSQTEPHGLFFWWGFIIINSSFFYIYITYCSTSR